MLDEKFKHFIQEWTYDQVDKIPNLTEHEKNKIAFEMQTDIEIDTEKTLERWLPHGN